MARRSAGFARASPLRVAEAGARRSKCPADRARGRHRRRRLSESLRLGRRAVPRPLADRGRVIPETRLWREGHLGPQYAPWKGKDMLDDMDKLVSLCKRRGFIFPSSEVYGGINGFWDYGPLGAELKRNIKD